MAAGEVPPGAPDAQKPKPVVSQGSIIAPRLPLTSRLYTGLCLWSFKIFVYSALSLVQFSRYLKKINQPSYVTSYSVRPNLPVRVFFPPGHSRGTKNATKLPTYLNIHGGGFALCDPSVDDHFCTALSQKHGYLVISLSYSLAPRNPFPIPVDDIEALIAAILADTTLPIDSSRVALGGFSAGGNLSLAAAQNSPSVGNHIKALVPIYPVVDFSGKYKGEFRTADDGQPDMLARTGAWFNWGYINPGQDRTDPRLSPIYATRDRFATQHMFFVGAEYDVLCHEAAAMARLLAGRKDAGQEPEENWQEKGIKWSMIRGVRHGFTHAVEKDKEREKKRLQVTDKLWDDVAEWLGEVMK